MYGNEFLKVYGFRENHVNQRTPTETIAIAAGSKGTKQNVVTTPDGAIFLGFLGFSVIGIIVFYKFSGFWKLARPSTEFVKYLEQVPCRNCRYFTDSPFLKCAVHPDTALTKLAIDCPDYCNSRVRSNGKK